MNLARLPLSLALSLAILASAADAQTITVTTSADATDVPMGATIADLPGPDGVVSFREALRAADNTPGHETIGFAIPEDDWYLPNIYPGQVLLQGSFSFNTSSPVTIDGTTQTAFTGDTFPGGNEVILPLQTYLNGDGTVVTGLHASRVELGGSNSEVYGNTGTMHIVLWFGTGSTVHDNEAYTINLTRASGNFVVRNTTRRVRISGTPSAPATGNVVGGPDPADRNVITGFGNYGEHGTPAGDCIELYYSADTLIQNNYIGTTPDGMSIGNPACTTGIAMWNSNHGVLVRDNLIAIRAVGVFPVAGVIYGQEIYMDLYLGGTGIEITGNTLGLDAAGDPMAGLHGIWVNDLALEEGADVRVGGPAPGEGNVIAGHLKNGVLLEGPDFPATGHVRLSGNAIYDNGEMGIDLMPNTWDFGPTPNDPLDADMGANGLQNYPNLLMATVRGGSLQVVGTLHSVPLATYTVELFASPACDPTGFGQGEVYLGATSVATDGFGNAAFQASVPARVPAGWVVTSTATREPVGETSEFSACRTIEARLMRAKPAAPRQDP